jgi:hypothetical protein
MDSSGNFYGTTYFGGANNMYRSSRKGSATIQVTTSANFNLDSGTLFGTTTVTVI